MQQVIDLYTALSSSPSMVTVLKGVTLVTSQIPKLVAQAGVKLPKDLAASHLLSLLIPGPYFLLNEWSEGRNWKKSHQSLPVWLESTPLPSFVSSKAEVLLLVSAVAASLLAVVSLVGFLWLSLVRLLCKKGGAGEEEGEASSPRRRTSPFALSSLLAITAYQAISTFALLYTDAGKFNPIKFLPKDLGLSLFYPSNFLHVGLLGLCLVFFHYSFAHYRPYLIIFTCEWVAFPPLSSYYSLSLTHTHPRPPFFSLFSHFVGVVGLHLSYHDYLISLMPKE